MGAKGRKQNMKSRIADPFVKVRFFHSFEGMLLVIEKESVGGSVVWFGF